MFRDRAISVLLVTLLLAAVPAAAATHATPVPAPTPAPFARVYLALRGCTSCSHCRSTIRKMVRSQAGKSGETRVDGDRVEVVYARPATVPLRAVVRGLARNRLHDLDLVDVLFEAEGSLRTAAGGAMRFTLRDTGQSFAVSIDRAVARPPDGTPVRLVALVEGWRGEGDLSLVAREVRGG